MQVLSLLVFEPDVPEDSIFGVLPRNKRHDYFTSCLPFPQKGPSLFLPFSKPPSF